MRIVVAGLLVVALGLLSLGPAPLPESARRCPQRPIEERPIVNLPQELRLRNWAPYGQGSCVHASTAMLCNWLDRQDLGTLWRASYHSGEWIGGLTEKLAAHGLEWVATTDPADVDFLDWACRTRRGCIVTVMQARHAVLLVHIDDERAGILDNNSPRRIRWCSREAFLREWRSGRDSQGRVVCWAVSLVSAPPPRLPFLNVEVL